MKNRIKRNFSQLPNEVIEDKNLSVSAKALFWYLASRPEDWEFVNGNIQEVMGFRDKHTIAKYLKELLETGWIEREKVQDTSGRLTGNYDYVINEFPFADRSAKISHFGDDNRSAKKSHHGVSIYINNKNIKRKNIKKENFTTQNQAFIQTENPSLLQHNQSLYASIIDSEMKKAKDFHQHTPSTRSTHKPNAQKVQILNINLPQNVGREMWEEFVEHRFGKEKKGLSIQAAKRLLNKLERLGSAGFSPDELLERSIINGWKDVYAPNVGGISNTASKSRDAQIEESEAIKAKLFENEAFDYGRSMLEGRANVELEGKIVKVKTLGSYRCFYIDEQEAQ